MGWWRPHDADPDRGVLDININAALSYEGPYDPTTGSASIRGQRCRISRLADVSAHVAAARRAFSGA